MDIKDKLSVGKLLERLSPTDRIYEELESRKILDNVIGFIPFSDSTDTSILITNIAALLAKKGLNTCILDAKVFYPSIYKLLDCEANTKGQGLIKVLRSDKVDLREEVNETKFKNLYILSSSPLDAIEEYFDFEMDDIERVINMLKDMFDMVLIDIPNIPPLEFCIASIKNCNVGFSVWSERVECPQNMNRFFEYIGSLGVGTSKFSNIIINNQHGFEYDKSIISEMNMRLIAEFPFVPAAINFSLEGKIYTVDGALMDKRYKLSIDRLVDLLTSD